MTSGQFMVSAPAPPPLLAKPPVADETPMTDGSGVPSPRSWRAWANLRIAQSGTVWVSSAMMVRMPFSAARSMWRS